MHADVDTLEFGDDILRLGRQRRYFKYEIAPRSTSPQRPRTGLFFAVIQAALCMPHFWWSLNLYRHLG